MSENHDLLFGLIALRVRLVELDDLATAFREWSLDPSESLPSRLARIAGLSQESQLGIEKLLAAHMKKHAGDAEKTLSILDPQASTRIRISTLAQNSAAATLDYSERKPGDATRDEREGGADNRPSEFDWSIDSDPLSAPTSAEGNGADHEGENGWLRDRRREPKSDATHARYRILRPHAKGGLGAVSVALDLELNREVALKEIQDSYADHEKSRRRFIAEAEVTGGLEHPGIVPVYGLGKQPNGRPFYAMRLIRGESLKAALATFHSRDFSEVEFRRLLRRFQGVCDAIEYAHSRGVLHRDIKPANIIAGPFGETLVIDWGLAKSIHQLDPASGAESESRDSKKVDSKHVDSKHDPAGLSASGLADSESGGANFARALKDSATAQGSALGTPGYMSPEQARGDLQALGPRSDVYSLGATLYSVLTGKAPFEGSAEDALEGVKKGSFPRPRTLVERLDPALEAICLRGMALDPADRYGSARELSEDLERWLAGEKVAAYAEPWTRSAARWLARRRVAVAAAAMALVVGLLGLGGVAATQARANGQLRQKNLELASSNEEIDRQRIRATERETQAIEAVRAFRDAVAQEPLLKDTPELDELRKRLTREPLAFFRSLRDQLQAEDQTEPKSLARLANASFELGMLSLEIGDPKDASAALEESRTIWRTLLEKDPKNAEYRSELAKTYNNLGFAYSDSREIDNAKDAFQEAIRLGKELVEEFGDNPELSSRLAANWLNFGAMCSQTGEMQMAKSHYNRAKSIIEELRKTRPDEPHYKRELAKLEMNLGDSDRVLGMQGPAKNAFDRALELERELSKAHPEDLGVKQVLAQAFNNLGFLKQEMEMLDAAQTDFEEALKIGLDLTQKHPTVCPYRLLRARCHVNLAGVLKASGNQKRARDEYLSAIADFRKLTEDFPTVGVYAEGLAIARGNFGEALVTWGQPVDARRELESSVKIGRPLVEKYPEVLAYRDSLANNLFHLANLLGSLNDPSGSKKLLEECMKLERELVARQPEIPKYRENLARMSFNLANGRAAQGDRPGAKAAYEEAIELDGELLDARQGLDAERTAKLALDYHNLGLMHHEAGELNEARAAYEAALRLRRKAKEFEQNSPDRASEVASALNNLAMLDMADHRFAEAQTKLKDAISLQGKALSAKPEQHLFREFLFHHLTNAIQAARELKKDDEADQFLRQRNQVKAQDPSQAEFEGQLRAVLSGAKPKDNAARLMLAQWAYETGRYAGAARLFEEALLEDSRLTTARESPVPYNAACCAALAAAGLGDDDPPPDEVARTRLREKAKEWLLGELATWTSLAEKATPSERTKIAATVEFWRNDTDLRHTRDQAELEKLSDRERLEWRALWEQVDSFLASAKTPESNK